MIAAYLEAAGLDDCELTPQDEQALAEEPPFAEFRVGDVFGKALHSKYHNPKDLVLDAEGYPYICASNANNGINKDLPRVNGDGLVLTPKKIIAWGKQCPMFCIHSEACVTSQGMYFLDMTAYSDRVCLYICSALDKACGGKFDYSNCLIGKVMDEQVISLPVVPSADPAHVYAPADIDWGYMERCIAELEEERVAELEAYLEAAGLDDCDLTPQDEQALAEEPPFAEFKVGDVFKPLKLKKYAKVPTSEGDVPFVSCKVTDNGIASYCGETPEVEHCITVSTNGNCFDCFWHDYPIIPSSDVEVLHLDGVTDSRERAVYICGVLAPNSALYSYTNKPKNGKVFDTVISLPVVPSADPSHAYAPADIDWGYMERYIRATEKLVMADVVAYKDRVIAETKRIVRQNGSHTAEGEAQPC